MNSNQSIIFVIDITKSPDLLYPLASEVVYFKLGIEIQFGPGPDPAQIVAFNTLR